MVVRITAALALLLFTLFHPLAASAAPPEPRAADSQEAITGGLLRWNGDARVAPSERERTVVVINGDAIIQGTVAEQLFVFNGVAQIEGTVEGSVTVVNGRLDLGPSSRVGGDVQLVRSPVFRDPGATVVGQVRDQNDFRMRWAPAWFFWLGVSLLVVVAGLVFAAIGGRQLIGAATTLMTKPGGALLTMLALWVGLPALAVLAFFTLVGVPLGLAILLFVIPALWFVGYLVAGTWIGELLVRAQRRVIDDDHPYLAVVLGLLLLQLIGLLPFVGGLILALAGAVGAGALVLRSWQQLRTSRAPA